MAKLSQKFNHSNESNEIPEKKVIKSADFSSFNGQSIRVLGFDKIYNFIRKSKFIYNLKIDYNQFYFLFHKKINHIKPIIITNNKSKNRAHNPVFHNPTPFVFNWSARNGAQFLLNQPNGQPLHFYCHSRS